LATAHETLPAALRMDETAAGVFSLVWQLPATQGTAPDMQPVLPDTCKDLGVRVVSNLPGAQLWRWQARCAEGLRGQRISIAGQENYLLDAVVRMAWMDGSVMTRVSRPRAPTVQFDAPQRGELEAQGFFTLGVEHILGGLDHLLFVFCLMLWVKDWWPLARTITGFTVGHSITLALASLGVVQEPGPPIEACIALSILFLAVELARRGQRSAMRPTGQRPWVVAAVFGLLHGFGFAGALREVGLPADGLGMALLMFNLGVEFGQLVFVAVVLVLAGALQRLVGQRRSGELQWAQVGEQSAVYGAGAVSAFWLLQRLVAMAATGQTTP
jgi:hydrogenase/urease accessory protein HupE